MPIRPENRDRYPKDWPAISRERRTAAGWRCEGSPAYPDCRAVNGEPHPVTGSKVVLTVAHLDHRPENVEPANLRAWCQRCHLKYDAPMHAANAEIRRLRALINAPELVDFSRGVVLEAAHQRERWGAAQDAGKAPSDWFWLIGYLGGKALAAALGGDIDKAKHHCISTAAALANWHAALLGADNTMRPGIAPPEGGR